jgi:hypothetical protein
VYCSALRFAATNNFYDEEHVAAPSKRAMTCAKLVVLKVVSPRQAEIVTTATSYCFGSTRANMARDMGNGR